MSNLITCCRILCRGWPGSCTLFLLLGAVVLGTSHPLRAQAPHDPVEEFKAALKSESSTTTDPNVLKARDTYVNDKAKNLIYLGDIARALLLQEWQAESTNAAIANTDGKVRKDLSERLNAGLKTVFESGDSASQAAAARLVQETASIARGLSGPRGFYVRQFFKTDVTPNLIAVINNPKTSDEVRVAALGALGLIEPAPEVAVSVLTNQFKSSQLPVRRAAADALADMVSAFLQRKDTDLGVTRTEDRKDAIKVGEYVVKGAPAGFCDADPEVRRLCVEACHNAARVLVAQIKEPYQASQYPPPGRKYVTDDEKTRIRQHRGEVEATRTLINGLLAAFATGGPPPASSPIGALAKLSATDPDVGVRLEARRTLEEVANARQRFLRLEGSVPVLEGEKPPPNDGSKPKEARREEPPSLPRVADSRPVTVVVLRPVAYEAPASPIDDLGAGLKGSLNEIVAGLSNPEVRARLAALDLLETMREDGAAALPALVKTLSDPDPFVRWAAARCVGKLAPLQPSLAVPKLVQRLVEEDVDVRVAVLTALELYALRVESSPPETKQAVEQPLKGAVPYLGQLVMRGDADSRLGTMRVLVALGANAHPALPAVATNLTDPNPRVRIGAATALGQFTKVDAKDARGMRSALQKALDDPDPDVRRAVSAALLRVSGK